MSHTALPTSAALPTPTAPSSPAQPPAVLHCQGVTKSYGPTVALAGVSLAFRPGESVAIMGPSGSGKSTLLHCLAGVLTADAGVIALHEPTGLTRVDQLNDEQRAALRRRLGFVFQAGLLLPELTAVENVALPQLIAGLTRPEALAAASAWLGHLGLAGCEDRRLGQLSGGQVQRVAIARSQVTGATVTFADEPTGALDRATSDEVMRALLKATVARGSTLIVVTHDDQVAAACSRIVRLQDGLVVHDSHPLALAVSP